MDYHGRIMNIERDPMKVASAPTDAAYFYGHRDARHAAAEIACEADAALEANQAEIARLREALEQIARPPNIVGVYHSRAVDQARAALAPVVAK